MNNNEQKIMVPNGWVVSEEVMSDGSRMLVIKPDTATTDDTACNQREGIFKKVPASELRLNDEFLKYCPKTEEEQYFKSLVETAIKSGLKDYWRPVCDPSLYNTGYNIYYEPGNVPFYGTNLYKWWERVAREFKPEQRSRLGTKNEYIAFLAVLIKELVNSGKSVEWAWNAVCNDSNELGHYRNSVNSKDGVEVTGSREICGFFDLANTWKIVVEHEYSADFWLAGGAYYQKGDFSPLATLVYGGSSCNTRGACGWIVFDGCPDC